MSGVDWSPVERELDRWEAAGLRLPVWWRDDDAVAPTPALERLLALAAEHRAPIAIASIPTTATEALAQRLAKASGVRVLVHGYAHVNHAPAGEKKAEFGAHRPLAARLAELAAAKARIEGLFGAQAAAVFTPPWNRIAPDLAPGLVAAGYATLSTFGPRAAPEATPGLAQLNTHLDPIDFKGEDGPAGGLKNPDRLARRVAELLAMRRAAERPPSLPARVFEAATRPLAQKGLKPRAKRVLRALRGGARADNAEPFGLLTHHLVHEERVWRFVAEWLRLLGRRPAVVEWRSIA